MPRRNRISSALLAAFSFLTPGLILSQPAGPIVIGQKIKLHSDILKEDRILWISAPEESHAADPKYPLLVLLDGDAHFVHTHGIVQFLADAGRMPKMIVVGIESTDRVRDFTPAPADPAAPGSGGADAFLRFLSDELLPYVESHYPAAPFRVLVGHSLGGSLVLNALLTRPRMANAYFILSPNLWWGNETLVNRLETVLKNTPKLDAFVYETATRRESARNLAATQRLGSLLDTYPVEALRWKTRFMEDESHQSIVHRSIYDGLESLFSPWEFRGDPSAAGMAGLQRHFQGLSDRYGYPIDPPEPLVNGLGYQSLGEGKVEEAIGIFQWNVRHYPRSANAYDSLGEAYAKKGDRKSAIESYEKSVALNPKNTAAIEILKKLRAK